MLDLDSLIIALTLTPTLSALLLGRTERPRGRFFNGINAGIAWLRRAYHGTLGSLFRFRWPIIGMFGVALLLTAFLFTHAPTGFTPDEDQGYFIVTVQAPEGSSIDQTERITKKVEALLKQNTDISDIFDVIGFGFTGNGPNKATMFVRLKDWKDRPGFEHSVTALLYFHLYPAFGKIPDAQIFAFNVPPVQGIGNVGGFQFELEDTGNIGLEKLSQLAYGYMGAAAQDPKLANVYTTFRADNPQLVVDVDRTKAASLNVPLQNIFNTMQIYLGSLYVNDFDYLNQSYRVYVQAETPYRSTIEDLQKIYVASNTGAIMPLTTLINTRQTKTPPVITHYNLFRSIEISGGPARGYGSGDALKEMTAIAAKLNPRGVSYEWSGLSLDETQSGSQATLVFLLGIVVVFLVLAAQYESWTDPFIILMSVPLAILGALIAIYFRLILVGIFGLGVGLVTSDVYAQVGYVMLIGLASKNAILIVEFANQLREQGMDALSAARQAAETRLRPILMTSLAFIFGIVPLAFASGAGSASRHSLGTPVLGGMIVSTVLNLFIVPVFYVVVVNFREGRRRKPHDPEPGHGGAGIGGAPSTELEPAPSV